MSVLILGLVVFLGAHSVRIVADGWRSTQIARRGLNAWKGLYSLLSLLGFALIIWGYALARAQPVPLWTPPRWAPHLSSLLMLFAFILLVAAYVPRNGIKAWVRHPMLLGVISWAIAHLLANGTLAVDAVLGQRPVDLPGAGVAVLGARRDQAAGDPNAPGTLAGALIALGVGVAAWALFAFWAHAWLFGVRPFG